jgi:ribosome-binding protein aMBF1 (putative translation factor)
MPNLTSPKNRHTVPGMAVKRPPKEQALPPAAVDLAEQIKRARLAAGLTQVQIAERLGIGQSVYARIEGGHHIVRLDTAQRIADVLGVRFAVIIAPAQGKPA